MLEKIIPSREVLKVMMIEVLLCPEVWQDVSDMAEEHSRNTSQKGMAQNGQKCDLEIDMWWPDVSR